MTAAIGVFGKHHGYGDFMSHRVDKQMVTWFQGWLDGVLPTLKDGMGDGWAAAWDNAPPIRFWIGRGLAGRTTAGLLLASRDKVGRRYPLVLLTNGADIAPPVHDPKQDYYTRLEAALSEMAQDDDIKDVVTGLPSSRSEVDAVAGEGPQLWAHHPDGDLGALLTSAAREDAKRAVTARSYWWIDAQAPDTPAIWLGLAGLPDSATLGWLMFGQATHLNKSTASSTGSQNA